MGRLLVYILSFYFLALGGDVRAGIVGIDADAGLPDKYITAICRDGRGLMWIGTRQGLCRYDGYRFFPVHGDLQNGTVIIKILYHAKSDKLWVAADKGLFTVDCRNYHVEVVKHASAANETATDICIDRNGRIYAAFKTGEIVAVEPGGRLRSMTRLAPINSSPTYANRLEMDGSDRLSVQVSGRGTSYRLDPVTGQMLRSDPDSISGVAFFRKIIGDTLFIGRPSGGLEIRDRSSYRSLYSSATRALQGIRDIIDVELQQPGVLFVLCKPSALFRIDLNSNVRDTISSEVFTGRLSTCFYFDPLGIIWLGTNKGLVRITTDHQYFHRLLYNKPSVSIRSIAEDENGRLYAGTYSGLFLSSDGGRQWSVKNPMIPYALLNAPGQFLYFVGEQKSFFRIDKNSLQPETGFYSTESLQEDELRQAYALAADTGSIIWIGTSNGLATYNPGLNRLAAFNVENGLPSNTEVRHIRRSKSGRLLVCTKNGLYELDRQLGVSWHLHRSSQPALSANTINYVDEDSKGRLWLCTDGGGINIVSRDRSKVTVLKTEDGLSDNTTYQLLWQGASRVWISTFNGLSSYDLKTGTFYNYYTADGLTSNEFNHNAFLRDHNGRMYFGTINGINAFFPDSIPRSASTARLFASTITKWDNATGSFSNLFPADTGAAIVLRPLDHSLTFNLAMTDYHNSESNIFRYRLKGLFDEWVTLSGQSALRLDGLAAGSYVLEVKALDSRGAPALNTLRYRVEVRQAFYKSWWFYLAMFVLASGLLWGFFFLRLQHVKRVQRLREQIASDLHDEVGSLLTRITMTSDNLRFSNNSEVERGSKLQKIAALSRTAASSMSDILWAIDARNDYTGNLADRMREHAEEMLLPLGIDLHFDFNVNQRMSIPSQLRQQLYLIYKEAINNIVKHSQAQRVDINYQHNEQGLKLRIVNDGHMQKEKPSTKGQGLKNMSMRARRVGAECKVDCAAAHFEVLIRKA